MFYGRIEELRELKKRYSSKKWEVGIVYGQRRIGKTSLILESVKNTKHIYLLCANTTEEDNKKIFSLELNKLLNLPSSYIYREWADIFDGLSNYISKNKLVIIIDELPFLEKVYPAIISNLQNFIDKNHNNNFKLVLSGSDMSFMEDLIHNKAKPLYRRNSFQIHLQDLAFKESLDFLKGFKDEDKIKCLSIFGGKPLYLEMLDKNISFIENIKTIFFHKFGYLLEAPQMVLPVGWGNSGTYTMILRAIAHRHRTLTDIAGYLNEPTTSISPYITRMINARILEKKEMFKGNQKTRYYKISDRMLDFYYGAVYNDLEDIKQGKGDSVFEKNKERIVSFISHGFEDVVIDYMNELNKEGKLPDTYKEFRKYEVPNSKLNRSVEIDGIAESITDKKGLIVIEDKFREKDISINVLNHLKESVSIFEVYSNIHYYLFSKKGFTKDLLKLKDKNVHLIDINKMING